MSIFRHSRTREKTYPNHPGTWARLTERTRFRFHWIRTSLQLHFAKGDADQLLSGQAGGAALMLTVLGGRAGKIAGTVAAAILLVAEKSRGSDGSVDLRIYNGAVTIGPMNIPVVLDPATPTAILQSFDI